MQVSNNCHGCGNHTHGAKNAHGNHAEFGKFMEQAQKEEKQERPEQPRGEQPQHEHEKHAQHSHPVNVVHVHKLPVCGGLIQLVPVCFHPMQMQSAHHGHNTQHGGKDSEELNKIMKSIAKMVKSGELTLQDLKDAMKAPDKKESSSIKSILEEYLNMVKNDKEFDVESLYSQLKQLAA